MKKVLLASLCLLAFPAMAQKMECALTPLQNLVVNARGDEEIKALISRGVVFDEQVRCGGSLMQLAVRRGNPAVLAAIIQQDPRRVNEMVTLDVFPIQGAPKQIPLILFAAYYAPNDQIVKLLVQAGAKIGALDDFGRNILWYLGKNPVLRNTELQDELNKQLLYGMIAPKQDQGAEIAGQLSNGVRPQEGQVMPEQTPRPASATGKLVAE